MRRRQSRRVHGCAPARRQPFLGIRRSGLNNCLALPLPTDFEPRSCLLPFTLRPPTGRQSFLNIQRWVEEVRAERGSDVIIVLVGNKTDLVDKRQVGCRNAGRAAVM